MQKLGADRVVLTNQKTYEEETGKFHIMINTLPENESLTPLVGLTRTFGTFVQLRMPAFGKNAAINTAFIILRHINFTDSLIGSRKETKAMLEFSAKHNVLPLCEQFEFQDFPTAFDTLIIGRPKFRCVVDAAKAEPKHIAHDHANIKYSILLLFFIKFLFRTTKQTAHCNIF